MPIYNLAWGVAVLPLLGVLTSFLAETQRRAAQICWVASALAFMMAAIVLGVRLAHAPAAAFDNVITFFAVNPPESTVFPGRFEPLLGIHVDALSAAFGAAVSFVTAAVQGWALTSLRRETGYRRFFAASSALLFAVAAFVFSPNLFQGLFMWVLGSAAIYLLATQWWQRPDAAAPARRVFLTLMVADLSLLLATVFVLAKFGTYAALLRAPAGQDISDPFAFTTVSQAGPAVAHGMLHGAGLRTLVVLSVLLLVAAAVRSAQLPFHLWFMELAGAPVAATALAVSVGSLPGVYLVARMYGVIQWAPHIPVAITLVGAVTMAFAAVTALAQRDLMRVGLLTAVAQLGMALAALGSGGYSAALFIVFLATLLSALFALAAGNVISVYHTRNLHETGGAWARMRITSLGLVVWAAGSGGLGLGSYYSVSSLLHNTSPAGRHIGTAGAVLAILLVLAGATALSLAAFRTVIAVCGGEPLRRRGVPVERITEVEPSLRRPVWLCGIAVVAAVLVALPGIQPIHTGKLSVPGLTFTRFVFFGAHRTAVPFEPLGLLLALAALAAGLAGARYFFGGERQQHTSRLVERFNTPVRLIARGLLIERTAHRAGQPVLVAAALAERFDGMVTAVVADSAAAGAMLGAAGVTRLRPGRSTLYLTVAVVAAGVLVLLAMLAATGHLWIHVT